MTYLLFFLIAFWLFTFAVKTVQKPTSSSRKIMSDIAKFKKARATMARGWTQ